MTTDTLISLVETWGEEKGLTGDGGKATIKGQYDKLEEEFQELGEALAFADHEETIDAIGDMTVVLILLCKLVEADAGKPCDFSECLKIAYETIASRTGKMVNGQFVKDK